MVTYVVPRTQRCKDQQIQYKKLSSQRNGIHSFRSSLITGMMGMVARGRGEDRMRGTLFIIIDIIVEQNIPKYHTPIKLLCQESHSELSNSPLISVGGVNRGRSVPTGVSVTGYEDRGLGTRWCPAGVGRWLVVPITKKAQAQLMCWPTDYRCLVGQRVR